jgi:hypothetical protein
MKAVLRRSRLPTVITNGLLAMLAAAPNTVRLWQGPHNPNPDADTTQFAEANYTGYVRRNNLLWPVRGFFTPRGTTYSLVTPGGSALTANGVGNLIGGVFLCDAANEWMIAWAFAQLYPLPDVTADMWVEPYLEMAIEGFGGNVEPLP